MALGTTDITTGLVRNAIGADSNNLQELCVHTSINKWSKYKPVRTNYPSSDGKYGFDLTSGWTYLRPRGTGYTGESYRLGDFRQYEHSTTSAYPTIRNVSSENLIRTLTPYPSGTTYYNTWKVRFYKTCGSSCISIADLGLSSYYYGMKISVGGQTWYKTYGTITAAADGTGNTITLDASMPSPPTASYYDLPYGTGTYTWTVILCSSAAAAWTQSMPSNVFQFPSDTFGADTLVTSGSFTVSEWIYADDVDHNWTATSLTYLASNLYYSGAGDFTIDAKPAWITVEVWDVSGVPVNITNDALWHSGLQLRIYPSENFGVARNGTVTMLAGGVTVDIAVSQDAVVGATDYIWTFGDANGITFTPISHGMTDGNTGFELHVSHNYSEVAWLYLEYTIRRTSGTPATLYTGVAGNSSSGFGVRSANQSDAVETNSLSEAITAGDTISITIDSVA